MTTAMNPTTTTPQDQPAAPKRIPALLSGKALQSLRDSGFSLPTALAEPIDNSLEADANKIDVRLDEEHSKRGKKRVHQIVIADDGRGMDDLVLQHYLQLGFSTRYGSTKTIGRYGVGAKLAALNFGRRIDVWSRTSGEAPWKHVYFDLDDALEAERRAEDVGIDPPTERALPEDAVSLAPSGSGTIVVWSKVERLEEGRRARDAQELRRDVEKELSRIFRYFLHDGIQITVNGLALLPHDPLFLLEKTWADVKLTEALAAGEMDEEPGAEEERPRESRHFPAEIIHEETFPIAEGRVRIRITLYPPEVTRRRFMGGDELAKRLRIPDNEGAISFVRLNREINYTNVPRIFPRGVEAADRFIGVEVGFSPELDDYFGVRNVKRGVEPHDELRAEIRKRLQKYLPAARQKIDERWGKVARRQRRKQGEHAPVVDAANEANRTMPKGRAKGPEDPADQKRLLEDLATDAGHTDEGSRHEYILNMQGRPFVLESLDFPGTNFIDVQHLNGQVIIRLNTRHRFYRELWEPVRDIADRTPGTVSGDEAVRTAKRTIEALTLLLLAYGKAESMHENPHEHYLDLRAFWGQFLDSLLGKVKDVR